MSFHPNASKDFCAFFIQKSAGLSHHQTEKFMILLMSNFLGKASSKEKITERMNQTITIPKIWRYNCVQGLTFTKESFTFKHYNMFKKQLKENQRAIKDMLEGDSDICTKFLFLADTELKF